MTDRRRTPANARVAAAHLRGRVDAPRYSEGEARQVCVPVADLRDTRAGRRERQLLFGMPATCYEDENGWAFVRSGLDGYVGYLPSTYLSRPASPTHKVVARATHLYSRSDFKSAERFSLSLGSLLRVSRAEGRFAATPDGFVPDAHIAPLERLETDPVAVAERLAGTPYLWGGNSAFGIDCSGLVQAACLACGIPCPGDSDMQEAELGEYLPEGAELQRGDLLFWKGHVAWVADPLTLIHANAFHMAVAYEPIEDAIERIAVQGDGPVTARKRLGE